MKKLISIFFLFIILFQSLGYFIAFKFSQLEIKKVMRLEILDRTPDSRLICISLTPGNQADVSWSEDHEFTYKGKMYDVVRSERKNDGSVNYFCLNDSKEEELLGNLNENLSTQLDANKMANSKTGKLMLKLFAFNFFDNPETHTCFFHLDDFNAPLFIPVYSSLSPEISSPPPRFI